MSFNGQRITGVAPPDPRDPILTKADVERLAEARCPTLCDPDCDEPCHEVHVVRWRRDHEPGECS